MLHLFACPLVTPNTFDSLYLPTPLSSPGNSLLPGPYIPLPLPLTKVKFGKKKKKKDPSLGQAPVCHGPCDIYNKLYLVDYVL